MNNSFLKDQNIYTKRLFAVFLVNLIVLVTVILTVIAIYIATKVKICNTTYCVLRSEKVYLNQNRSVNPCDNFFEFACGNQKRNQIYFKENKYRKFYEEDISENQDENGSSRRKSRSDSNTKDGIIYLKKFLNKCVEKTGSELDRLKDLSEVLNFPLSKDYREQWDSTYYHFEQSMVQLIEKNLNFQAFFRFYIGYPLSAYENSSPVTPAYIITAPRLSDLNKPLAKNLEKFVRKLRNYDNLKDWEYRDIRDVRLLYNELFFTGKRQLIDFNHLPLHKKIKFSKLKKKYKNLFTYNIVKSIIKSDMELNDDTIFYITRSEKELRILHNANKILEGPNPEGMRAIINYMLYVALIFADNFVHDKFDRNSLIENCLDMLPVDARLLFAFRMLYLIKHTTKIIKHEMLEFTNQIIHELHQSFYRQKWMDEKTRTLSIKKLKNITIFIGVPKEYEQKKTLNEEPFTELPEFNDNDSLFDICMRLRKSYIEYQQRQINNVDSKLWQFDESEEIVTYIHQKNTLLLSIELLDSESFLKNLPALFRYGSLGPFIAAKLTQGFDILGQYFEADGSYKPWWTKRTYDEFEKRSNCLREQYDQYIEPNSDTKVSGDGTFQENIADNNGMRILYKTYESLISKRESGTTIPAFPNYTPRQVFWVLYAQAFCSFHKTKFLQSLLNKSYYAPARFRVIGTLVNSREFAYDFNCEKHSKMNPTKKCIIWQ